MLGRQCFEQVLFNTGVDPVDFPLDGLGACLARVHSCLPLWVFSSEEAVWMTLANMAVVTSLSLVS
jgi:hypothetical protein